MWSFHARTGDDNWDVAWGDTTAALFRGVQKLKPFQRVNHFPLLGLSGESDGESDDECHCSLILEMRRFFQKLP